MSSVSSIGMTPLCFLMWATTSLLIGYARFGECGEVQTSHHNAANGSLSLKTPLTEMGPPAPGGRGAKPNPQVDVGPLFQTFGWDLGRNSDLALYHFTLNHDSSTTSSMLAARPPRVASVLEHSNGGTRGVSIRF